MNLADTIKQTVTMRDICSQYGFSPNYAGYISCPFHGEKTPSLRIYDGHKGWHCFGCGSGGSVIDFVMKLYDINFSQAVTRIGNDFGIISTDCDHKPSELRRKREQERIKIRNYQKEYDERCAEYRRLRELAEATKPQPEDASINPGYLSAIRELQFLDFWFENHHYKPGGDND